MAIFVFRKASCGRSPMLSPGLGGQGSAREGEDAPQTPILNNSLLGSCNIFGTICVSFNFFISTLRLVAQGSDVFFMPSLLIDAFTRKDNREEGYVLCSSVVSKRTKQSGSVVAGAENRKTGERLLFW